MQDLLEPGLEARREDVASLCRQFGVAALDVFGSAVNGQFDPSHSDYDFIVRFHPRPDVTMARRYLAFHQALEALLGRTVDLMTDHPIDNPYLRRAITATRTALYVDPAAQAPA
jgi:uncharacterized protein